MQFAVSSDGGDVPIVTIGVPHTPIRSPKISTVVLGRYLPTPSRPSPLRPPTPAQTWRVAGHCSALHSAAAATGRNWGSSWGCGPRRPRAASPSRCPPACCGTLHTHASTHAHTRTCVAHTQAHTHPRAHARALAHTRTRALTGTPSHGQDGFFNHCALAPRVSKPRTTNGLELAVQRRAVHIQAPAEHAMVARGGRYALAKRGQLWARSACMCVCVCVYVCVVCVVCNHPPPVPQATPCSPSTIARADNTTAIAVSEQRAQEYVRVSNEGARDSNVEDTNAKPALCTSPTCTHPAPAA
jgi:hypothetical protein